jgi:hypothetical protein
LRLEKFFGIFPGAPGKEPNGRVVLPVKDQLVRPVQAGVESAPAVKERSRRNETQE